MTGKAMRKGRVQRRLTDLVGIDFSTTGTKVVRMKRGKSGLVLTGLDLLPPVEVGNEGGRLELPRSLVSNYGCLVYTGSASVVRMVNTQLEGEDSSLPESRLRELLNVRDDFRVNAKLITKGKGGKDSSLLAAAIPSDDVRVFLDQFAEGAPSPVSIEVASLSFIPAFLNSCGSKCDEGAICLIDAGESVSNFAFLNNGAVVLVGKMGFGAGSLREKLASDLGVDEDLVLSILDDQSINISASVSSILEPFLRQVSISKDFIERHLGCRVSRVFVSGGMSLLPDWISEVGQKLHVEVVSWDPLENIQKSSGVVSSEMEAQVTRFSAVIGAVIGGFEEA